MVRNVSHMQHGTVLPHRQICGHASQICSARLQLGNLGTESHEAACKHLCTGLVASLGCGLNVSHKLGLLSPQCQQLTVKCPAARPQLTLRATYDLCSHGSGNSRRCRWLSRMLAAMRARIRL